MTDGPDEFTDRAEAEWHHRLAVEIFGLRIDPGLPVEAERNVLSITAPDICFAQRLDCRTYFIQTLDRGEERRTAAYSGPDEEQFAFARSLFRRLGISDSEIAGEHVLREYGRAAEIDPESRRIVSLESVSELGNSVHVTRQVEGVPVWSSHLRVSLDAERRIDYLELHWPFVPETVLREARRLAFMVGNGWRPPSVSAAEIESVEAGIVHSPPIGYFFDIHAAVRVIYRPTEAGFSRRPTYHLDRHGEPVRLRRTDELIHEPPQPSRSEAGGTPPGRPAGRRGHLAMLLFGAALMALLYALARAAGLAVP